MTHDTMTPAENTTHSYDTNANRKSNANKVSKLVRGREIGVTTEWTRYKGANDAAKQTNKQTNKLILNQGSVSLLAVVAKVVSRGSGIMISSLMNQTKMCVWTPFGERNMGGSG